MLAPIEMLRALLAAGEFHHATYRCIGTVWEGLWFYKKSADGFRGYECVGCVAKGDPDLDAAHALVAHTGISVGAYGGG